MGEFNFMDAIKALMGKGGIFDSKLPNIPEINPPFSSMNQSGQLKGYGSLLGAGVNGVLGFNNYNMAKEKFNQERQLNALNYANSAKMLNKQLSDRAITRNADLVGSGVEGQHGTLEEVMKKYGVADKM